MNTADSAATLCWCIPGTQYMTLSKRIKILPSPQSSYCQLLSVRLWQTEVMLRTQNRAGMWAGWAWISGLKSTKGLQGIQRPTKEQEDRIKEPHPMPDPYRCPLSGQAVGSELSFTKVPPPKMGKPRDRETNCFASIYLNKYFSSPLHASTKNAKLRKPCPLSVQVCCSKEETSTHQPPF